MGFCRGDSCFGDFFIAFAATSSRAQTLFRGVSRSRISVAISLGIVVVAAIVLYHLLRDIEISKVIDALKNAAEEITHALGGRVP